MSEHGSHRKLALISDISADILRPGSLRTKGPLFYKDPIRARLLSESRGRAAEIRQQVGGRGKTGRFPARHACLNTTRRWVGLRRTRDEKAFDQTRCSLSDVCTIIFSGKFQRPVPRAVLSIIEIRKKIASKLKCPCSGNEAWHTLNCMSVGIMKDSTQVNSCRQCYLETFRRVLFKGANYSAKFQHVLHMTNGRSPKLALIVRTTVSCRRSL